eukprot:scaffold13046_cov76-Isochrysis_galbana.AAC.1
MGWPAAVRGPVPHVDDAPDRPRAQNWRTAASLSSCPASTPLSPAAAAADPKFKKYVVAFAKSETVFRSAFKRAYEQLLCLGCPAHVVPSAAPVAVQSRKEAESRHVLDHCMHGSLEFAQARRHRIAPHGKPWGRGRGRVCHREFGVVGVAGGPRLLSGHLQPLCPTPLLLSQKRRIGASAAQVPCGHPY